MPFYPDEVRPERLSAGERVQRLERRRLRQRVTAVLVAVVVAALVVAVFAQAGR